MLVLIVVFVTTINSNSNSNSRGYPIRSRTLILDYCTCYYYYVILIGVTADLTFDVIVCCIITANSVYLAGRLEPGPTDSVCVPGKKVQYSISNGGTNNTNIIYDPILSGCLKLTTFW